MENSFPITAHCPSCHAAQVKNLGKVPESFHFCETRFDKPFNSGSLYLCKRCNCHFKNPLIPEQKLLELYDTHTPEFTQMYQNPPSQRNDFEMMKQQLVKIGARKILEIGCYTGSFASHFRSTADDSESELEWHGVEPSHHAAAIAQKAGITMIGKNILDASENMHGFFDAIIAIDVIEHMTRPMEFFTKSYQLLKSDGHVILTSGAVDTVPVFFRRYWNYVAMPEHMIFLSALYAENLAHQSQM